MVTITDKQKELFLKLLAAIDEGYVTEPIVLPVERFGDLAKIPGFNALYTFEDFDALIENGLLSVRTHGAYMSNSVFKVVINDVDLTDKQKRLLYRLVELDKQGRLGEPIRIYESDDLYSVIVEGAHFKNFIHLKSLVDIEFFCASGLMMKHSEKEYSITPKGYKAIKINFELLQLGRDKESENSPMDGISFSLEDKSLVFLKRLYDKVKHDTEIAVSVFELGGDEFTEDEALQVRHYLIEERWVAGGRIATGSPDICITTQGIKKIEHSFSNGAPPISILFLAADPTNASRLRLGEEFREIQEKLKLAKLRDNFRLELPQLSVRPADISQAMLDVEPQIVHFSGHVTSTGALCFENQVGQTHLVEPQAIAALFEQFAHQVKCVMLNACFSDVQAEAIAQYIEYVIGMNQEIGDKAAIAFAIGFYQALGAGRTIEEAYKLGCVQIRLQGIAEHSTPIIKSFGLKILKVLSPFGSGGRTKRGIGDDTGLDITTVTHQLNVLKKNGYVSVKRTNGERWFITEQGKKLLKDTSGESSDLSQ